MQVLPHGQTNDVEVTWADQERINAFSKLNSRIGELEEQVKVFETEKEYIDDAILELELIDEDEKVQYKIGDSFVYLKLSDALVRLQEDSGILDTEIEKSNTEISSINDKMAELKEQLYAKFGSNINLER